jgi:signal transduction histidine kinase
MSGSVSVVSHPDEGSRFTIRLPLEAAPLDVPAVMGA